MYSIKPIQLSKQEAELRQMPTERIEKALRCRGTFGPRTEGIRQWEAMAQAELDRRSSGAV